VAQSATTGSPTPASPEAPNAVSAVVNGNAEVIVNWDTVTNANSYQIGRSEKIGKGNNWSAIQLLVEVEGPTFNDPPGAGTYRYYVSSQNEFGVSDWSNGAQVKVSDGSSGGSGGSGGSGSFDCARHPNHWKCTGS
jgi:hypothetical protein